MAVSRATREILGSGALYGFACGQVLPTIIYPSSGSAARVDYALLIFAGLAACYLGLSLTPVQDFLRLAVARNAEVRYVGPILLWMVVLLYAFASHSSLLRTAAPYGAYLIAPLVITAGRYRTPVDITPRLFLVAAVLWLPLVFWLPPLRLPGGFEMSHLIAIVSGLYLFLIVYHLERIGYSFALSRRDIQLAGAGLAAYVIFAIPAGLESRFLVWHPRPTLPMLLAAPIRIYLTTAIPEEFLFRGVIQNLLMRRLGATAGLLIGAVIFGFAHLPDHRYVLLAMLAGLAYGWVYMRTERITASAVTHAAVDWIWVLAFRR